MESEHSAEGLGVGGGGRQAVHLSRWGGGGRAGGQQGADSREQDPCRGLSGGENEIGDNPVGIGAEYWGDEVYRVLM